MARSAEQIDAWVLLLELCRDDCETFRTSPEMRGAIIEVENELKRLHDLEDKAIKYAQKAIRLCDPEFDLDFDGDAFCNNADEFRDYVVLTIPVAFKEH